MSDKMEPVTVIVRVEGVRAADTDMAFTAKDLGESVEATLMEVYPTSDNWPVVPTVTVLDYNAPCDPANGGCGHVGHQTGEGPWSGFCADDDCKCESPRPVVDLDAACVRTYEGKGIACSTHHDVWPDDAPKCLTATYGKQQRGEWSPS